MHTAVCLAAAALSAAAPLIAQGSAATSVVRMGDDRRVDWVRPWAAAQKAARQSGRLLLVKPILGGSNTPDPTGVPCGGKSDCEGSW